MRVEDGLLRCGALIRWDKSFPEQTSPDQRTGKKQKRKNAGFSQSTVESVEQEKSKGGMLHDSVKEQGKSKGGKLHDSVKVQ